MPAPMDAAEEVIYERLVADGWYGPIREPVTQVELINLIRTVRYDSGHGPMCSQCGGYFPSHHYVPDAYGGWICENDQ